MIFESIYGCPMNILIFIYVRTILGFFWWYWASYLMLYHLSHVPRLLNYLDYFSLQVLKSRSVSSPAPRLFI
jgi:hypothetical protein